MKERISASLEDYLEMVYLIQLEKENVKAIEVAKRLNVSKSSACEALKLLADKEMLNYGRYEPLTITDLGKKTAKKILEKHEVLYKFFNQILGVDNREAQKCSCEIEHVISDDILDKLSKFVENNSNVVK